MWLLTRLLPPSLPRQQRRRIRARLALAAAFLALGIGNVVYGQRKYAEYDSILSKVNAELTSPETAQHRAVFPPTVNIDKQSQDIEKARSHIGFYHLVTIGGACFTTLGLFFLLLAALRAREGAHIPPHPSESDSP